MGRGRDVLPVIERKDLSANITDRANLGIKAACEQHKINILEPFKTVPSMYYDNVHLNDKSGLPSLIKHIKNGMNLTKYRSKAMLKPTFSRHPIKSSQWATDIPRDEQTKPKQIRENSKPSGPITTTDPGNAGSYQYIPMNSVPVTSQHRVPNFSLQNIPVSPWIFTSGVSNTVPMTTAVQNQNIPWVNSGINTLPIQNSNLIRQFQPYMTQGECCRQYC